MVGRNVIAVEATRPQQFDVFRDGGDRFSRRSHSWPNLPRKRSSPLRDNGGPHPSPVSGGQVQVSRGRCR